MWWFINLLWFIWWQSREIMQSVYREAGLYLLQGFQQLPQGKDGDHHNPSRDDASNLKDTHLPSAAFSQRAGCVHDRAHSHVHWCSWPPPSAHTIEGNKNYLLKLYKTEEKWKSYIYIAAMAGKWKKLWRLSLLNKASLTWISSGYIRPLVLGSIQEAKLLRKQRPFSFPTIDYGDVLGKYILREFTDSSALLNQQP